jgi:hypothetical protein
MKTSVSLPSDRPLIYLCGAIGDRPVHEAVAWRQEAAKLLSPEFHTLSPLRDFADDPRALDSGVIAARETARAFTDAEIVERDLIDIRRSYLLLRHYNGPSEGSPMECAYAKVFGVPVVISGVANTNDVSPWMRYHAVRILPDLTSAARYIKKYWAL